MSAGACRRIRQIGREILALCREFDVLLQPVTHHAAAADRISRSDRMCARASSTAARASIFGYTPLANLTGQPSMSRAAGHVEATSCRIGMMFTGRYGDEATLFRLAAQLERASPWIDRKPPIWG